MALGCDGKPPAETLSCLRGKTTEEVILALPTSAIGLDSTSASWFPVVDGLNIADHPITLLEAGAFTKVPTLLGSNADEGTIFFALGNAVTDEASYLAAAETLSPGNGSAVVAHYPSATYGSPKAAATVAFGDGFFVCTARRTARALANASVPTYLYHFTYAGEALLPDLGAFHSGEIPFVFGNHTQLLAMSPTEAEKPLLQSMQGYWGRMAATGDPNGDGAFTWPKYDASTDEHVVLDLTTSKGSGLKKTDCDFWDSL
jgi:para-nitrobenzyl esterase